MTRVSKDSIVNLIGVVHQNGDHVVSTNLRRKQLMDKLARGERLFDWVWTGGKKAQWRPVDSYTIVKRGYKKGQYRCTLPDGSKVVVPRQDLRLEKDGLKRIL